MGYLNVRALSVRERQGSGARVRLNRYIQQICKETETIWGCKKVKYGR